MGRVSLHLGRRGGFSLLEIVISMAVLGIGVMAISGTLSFSVRGMALAEFRGDLVQARQYTVERLRGLPYDSVRDATVDLGEFQATIAVLEDSTSKTVELVTAGGLLTAGTARWMADTVLFQVPRS